MKLAISTPTIDFTALKGLSFIHTADWQIIELRHKQSVYTRLYERYTKLLLMEEEGIEVTITMHSGSHTLTVTDDDSFQPMEYLGQVGKWLSRLGLEILALQEKLHTTGLNGETPGAVAENEQRRQALALCLPAITSPAEAQPNQSAPAKAA